MRKSKYQTLFCRSRKEFTDGNIFIDRRILVQITIINCFHYIYIYIYIYICFI
jgi:hypothetical protein